MSSSAYTGSCHCGAIGYSYRSARAIADWSVRACQCSFCRAHGAWCTSDSAGSLQLAHQDSRQLQRYRFALRTADFLICRVCGSYIGAMIQTRLGEFATINVRALDCSDNFSTAESITYDAEDYTDRVARREQHWTPVREH